MKALKQITGILLATVGVIFTLSAVAEFFDQERDFPLWILGAMFVVLGLLPLVGAFALLWKPVTAPSKPCPQCGGRERQPAGVLRTSRNPWLFHLGGWLFASLWGGSRERQVRCAACETLYMTDTRGTRIAGILLWVFILMVVSGVILQQFE